MIRNIIAITGIFFVIGGCSSDNVLERTTRFDKEITRYNRLLKTEKCDFETQTGDTAASVIAVYLPSEDRSSTSESHERFIVVLYDYSDNEIDPSLLSFTLNGKSPLRLRPIALKEAKQLSLPFLTPWATLLEVTFARQQTDRLYLEVLLPGFSPKRLYFTKHAKYIHSHRAFD